MFQWDFTRYSLPVLNAIDNGSRGADRQLQNAMVILRTAICPLASTSGEDLTI